MQGHFLKAFNQLNSCGGKFSIFRRSPSLFVLNLMLAKPCSPAHFQDNSVTAEFFAGSFCMSLTEKPKQKMHKYWGFWCFLQVGMHWTEDCEEVRGAPYMCHWATHFWICPFSHFPKHYILHS